jgi:hypothetical protein
MEIKYICRHYYNDRLFSQIVRHLLSFFISKILNITHIHIPYKNNDININFEKIYKINNLIDETIENHDINKLMKEKLIYSKPDQNLVGLNNSDKSYFDINDIFSDTNINLMRSSYKLNKVSNDYLLSDINVCLHIRRGDIAKYGNSCGRFTPIIFFIDTITTIQGILGKKCVFHIYSDSEIKSQIENKNIGSISNIDKCNIKYHINTDLLTGVNEMIQSDIFIMSIGSNLSHFVGLHTSGIVFIDKNKLTPCFNNKYNIYWSKYRHFIKDKEHFKKEIYHRFKNTSV